MLYGQLFSLVGWKSQPVACSYPFRRLLSIICPLLKGKRGNGHTLDIAPLGEGSLLQKRFGMARVGVVEGFHSGTYHPRVYPRIERTMPAFTFPAKAGPYLPTPEGCKVELVYTPPRRVNSLPMTAAWRLLKLLLAVQISKRHASLGNWSAGAMRVELGTGPSRSTSRDANHCSEPPSHLQHNFLRRTIGPTSYQNLTVSAPGHVEENCR